MDNTPNGELPIIRYEPTDGLTYNPNEPKYWERSALDKELHRAFDLCNGCRLCFRFCQSFPILFEAIDTHGDVRRLPAAVTDQVLDACFQCKLCYTNCPYTEAEGHEFKLDFPRLLHRANAMRRRAKGVPLRERVLGNPDALGRFAKLTPRLANWANTFRPHRLILEKVLGIHRDKRLPVFADKPFERWFREQTQGADETPSGIHPVVLFATCYVNYNKPAVGQATYSVLTHNDCKVACPSTPCCGMPAFDGGNVAQAREQARANVQLLQPYVAQGYKIAAINPTCSLMMKHEYPELLNLPDEPAVAEAARQVAAATQDISEFLFELRRQGHFKEDFKSTPNGTVAYHAPCHLRMQNVGFRGRDLMRRIPGVRPKLVAECCGHDGTWAMKRENFNASFENGKRAFDGMQGAEAACWSTDCPLAALQFEQACGQSALHPVEVLDRAYRADGFAQRVEEEPQNSTE